MSPQVLASGDPDASLEEIAVAIRSEIADEASPAEIFMSEDDAVSCDRGAQALRLLRRALRALDAQCAVSEVYYDDTAEVRREIVDLVGE